MAARPLTVWLKQPFGRLSGVPVFNYHGIGRATTAELGARRLRKYWVRRAQLAEQLRTIRSHGFTVALLSELGTETPSVVLTFDDGTASHYEEAFPLLQDARARAEFFINPANMGERGYLTWDQAREMQSAGMSFQSHGYDHVPLSRLGTRTLDAQLADSKREIEARLGAPVRFLAVPYGIVSARVIEAALEQGYQAVCTSRCWPAAPGEPVVTRVPVYASTTNRAFRRLLEGRPVPYLARALRSGLLHVPQAFLHRVWPGTLGVSVLEKRA